MFLSRNTVLILANSANSDGIPHFHLGLIVWWGEGGGAKNHSLILLNVSVTMRCSLCDVISKKKVLACINLHF